MDFAGDGAVLPPPPRALPAPAAAWEKRADGLPMPHGDARDWEQPSGEEDMWTAAALESMQLKRHVIGSGAVAPKVIVKGCAPVAREAQTGNKPLWRVDDQFSPTTLLGSALSTNLSFGGCTLKVTSTASKSVRKAVREQQKRLSVVWRQLYLDHAFSVLQSRYSAHFAACGPAAFDSPANPFSTWDPMPETEPLLRLSGTARNRQHLGWIHLRTVVQYLLEQDSTLPLEVAFAFAVGIEDVARIRWAECGEKGVGQWLPPINTNRMQQLLPVYSAAMQDMALEPGMLLLTLARSGELRDSNKFYRTGEGEVPCDVPLLMGGGTAHWREKNGWMDWSPFSENSYDLYGVWRDSIDARAVE